MTFDTALWRILLRHAVGCGAMPIIIIDGTTAGQRVERANPQFSCPSMVLHVVVVVVVLLSAFPFDVCAQCTLSNHSSGLSNGTAPAPSPSPSVA